MKQQAVALFALDMSNGLLVTALSLIHITGFIAVTIYCLRNRKDPSASLLWIFVAWSLPFIGILLFLAFGINKAPSKGWQKHRINLKLMAERRAREDAELPLAYWRSLRSDMTCDPEQESARDFNDALNRLFPDNTLLRGNDIAPLVCGDEAYPAMLAAIREAKHHIHLQTFILGHEEIGRLFLEALRERAEKGVQVRLLYDAFGSTFAMINGQIRRYRNTPNMQIAGWSQSNPIKRHMQINLRNHRKALIVDGTRAFIGGINLRRENISRAGRPAIRDYHFALCGPIVYEVQYTFLRDWYYITDENPERLLIAEHFQPCDLGGSTAARIINTAPKGQNDVMTDVFFAAIQAARKQLIIVTPYFVPPSDIIRSVRAAALRGVDTRLLLPQKNNHFYAGLASRALYEDLLRAGVKVYERQPPFIHAKALIADDALSIIGTSNFDVRSLKLNYETNLAVFDTVFINKLKKIIIDDLAVSNEIDAMQWRQRPIINQIAENFCNLLTPIL